MAQIIITPWGDEMDKDEYDMIRREEEHDRMLEAQEHGADDDDDYYIECTFSVKGDKMTVSQSGYSLVYNRVSDSLIQRYL